MLLLSALLFISFILQFTLFSDILFKISAFTSKKTDNGHFYFLNYSVSMFI